MKMGNVWHGTVHVPESKDWQGNITPALRVRIQIDIDGIAITMGRKAAGNRSGRSNALGQLVQVEVMDR